MEVMSTLDVFFEHRGVQAIAHTTCLVQLVNDLDVIDSLRKVLRREIGW